ncbi:MAG: exosortase family protein XrtF [Bacteroidota bacterium]
MNVLKEFKTPILFLVKFLAIYLLASLVYGIFISSYSPSADPITDFVTENTQQLLVLLGYPVSTLADETGPYVKLVEDGTIILSVFEGCNGVNVSIVFLAFLVAYSRPVVQLVWFIPLGLFIIHLVNLLRISFLFYVSKNQPDYLYFAHKYLFTAIIYAVIFLLWYIWVNKLHRRKAAPSTE